MAAVLTTGPTKVPVYNSPVVAACGGDLYIAYPYGILTEAGNQSSPPLLATVPISMCFLNLTVFAVDGTHITTLPLQTGSPTSTPSIVAYLPPAWVANTPYAVGAVVLYDTVLWYVATAAVTSATPPSSDTAHWNLAGPPTNCSLCCNWRGRFVLAGDSANPQNFYMARVGSPYDWNYAALDPAAAVAGNLSKAGQIGEPIVALIPYTDDYMLIGCTNSLWMLQGDPADGGTIVCVSNQMGLISANAWVIDPAGVLYFIARGGLYSVRPIWEFYQPPQLLSGETYDQYFETIINGSYYVSMQWDVDAKYMHIFATPTDGATVGTHLIFDQRNGGLWPQQYALNQGPTATMRYSANNINGERAILLGGWDGYIRQWTSTGLDDDGTAIEAYAVLGPIKADPQAAIFSGITIDFGEVLLSDNPPAMTTQTMTAGHYGTHEAVAFTYALSLPVTSYTVYLDGAVASVDNGLLTSLALNGSGNLVIMTTNAINSPPVVVTVSYPFQPPVPWNVDVLVAAGPDAYSVTEGLVYPFTPGSQPSTPAGQYHSVYQVPSTLDRRQKTYRQRFRGGWFSLILNNNTDNTYWSFESALLEFMGAGRNREVR